MCLILDANKFSDFAEGSADMKPARRWVEDGGGIAYTNTQKFQDELQKGPAKIQKLFEHYRRSNKLKKYNEETVENMQQNLERVRSTKKLKSDDLHIIALALVSKSKLLVSNDKNLHADFRKETKGNIYQTASHRHLLNNIKCP